MSETGVAVVSNTLVCEVSRLLNPAGLHMRPYVSRPGDPFRVLDLMSLIEAVVLHDHLITLPISPDVDTSDLALRATLLERSILQQPALPASYEEIGVALQSVIQRHDTRSGTLIMDYFRPSWRDRNEAEFSQDIARLARETVQDSERLGFADERSQDPDGRRFARAFLAFRGPKVDDSFEYFHDRYLIRDVDSDKELAATLVRLLMSRSTGSYETATSLLRDICYISVAECMSVPYWPDSARIETARKYGGSLGKPLRLKLYEKLASALHTSVDDLFDDSSCEVAHVPPFAAIVFDRSTSLEDVPRVLLELREEYAELRHQFYTLEEARRDARSLAKRRKLRREQERLLNHLGNSFDSPSRVSLEAIVRAVPDITSAAATSSVSPAFATKLLSQPIERLVEWWQRRPISLLFDVANKVKNIETYEGLLKKVIPNPELRRTMGNVDWGEYMIRVMRNHATDNER